MTHKANQQKTISINNDVDDNKFPLGKANLDDEFASENRISNYTETFVTVEGPDGCRLIYWKDF